jgi:hypothetical protein
MSGCALLQYGLTLKKIVGTFRGGKLWVAFDPDPFLAMKFFYRVFFKRYRYYSNFLSRIINYMKERVMARKRINGTAALTAAEKQKRHREKQAAEKLTAAEDRTERLRKQFVEEINELPPEQLMKLIELHDNPPKYPDKVTMKEFCAITGISEYEFKKLEAQGVIEPIESAHPSGLTKKEIANIERSTGLTADEFLRFLPFCGKENMTMQELSKAANIPIRKLEHMDALGILYQSGCLKH